MDDGVVARAHSDSNASLARADTEELARWARGGETAPFAELARRYRSRLVAALSGRLGGSLADAEDVTQDALTKAWRNIGRFDETRCFATWLYTIAFRQATDFLRSKERRLHHTQRVHAPSAQPATAEEDLARREASDNLWATARRELSPPQYVALWLRYAEDLSIRDVAKVMGKTRVGTRVLLHRARSTLEPHLTRLAQSPGEGL